MDGNLLVVVAGIILSLLFGYVGGFKAWYEALDGVRKAQVMLGLNLLAAGVIAGGSCWLGYDWMTCDEGGWRELARLFFLAMTANQVTYQTLVRPRHTAAG